MRINKTLLTTGIMVALLIIGAILGVYSTRYYTRSPAPDTIQGLLWPNPKQINVFTTVDQNGNPFGLKNLEGKWSLLFFGYTYCPDVCPLTLTVLDQIHSRLQQQLKPGIQTIFITVDPTRDTPLRLTDYVSFFNNEFIGLGGTTDQVNSLSSQIGIAWSHGPAAADGSYLVNHSSAVFLLDPKARLVGIFSAPHDDETLMTNLVRITDFVQSQD